MVKQSIQVKYNTNCQAYTAIISDNQGNTRGIGYGNSKLHAVKMAKLEASGKINRDGLVSKISVSI